LALHRFLAVTGLSGSGKSSLVRTGLLNALERGLLVEAGSDWRVADFRPGGRPFSRLVAALADALGAQVSGHELGLIEAKLARGPLGLVGWLDEIEFSGETNLLCWSINSRRFSATGKDPAATTSMRSSHCCWQAPSKGCGASMSSSPCAPTFSETARGSPISPRQSTTVSF